MAEVPSEASTLEALKRRNWLAIALGTVVMMFSYFPYASAFVTRDSGEVDINLALVGLALVVAPFVFIVLGFVSRNPKAPKRVLQSMVLLILLGLSVGLLAPVLGATAAFSGGAALCLNPPFVQDVYKWRIGAAVLVVVYSFLLLLVATPAGVFTGGLIPLLMVGFADEYSIWARLRVIAESTG